MKKILETLKRKWAEYLLEMIVIMFGILGAFMLNNWNEGKKERLQEIQLLTELHADLVETENNFVRNINSARQAIQSKNVIIDIIEQELPYSDSLQQHFKRFWYVNRPELIKTTYSSIENWQISNLSNDSLRREIVSLFQSGEVYLELLKESQWDVHMAGHYQNLLGLLFDFRDIYNTKPFDYKLLLKSKDYAKKERVALGTLIIVTDGRESILQQVKQLKENVKMEITRLSK